MHADSKAPSLKKKKIAVILCALIGVVAVAGVALGLSLTAGQPSGQDTRTGANTASTEDSKQTASQKTYTITYYVANQALAQAGVSKSISQQAPCGKAVTLYKVGDTDWIEAADSAKYLFVGWTTQGPGQSESEYEPGEVTDALSNVAGDNISLYAVWRAAEQGEVNDRSTTINTPVSSSDGTSATGTYTITYALSNGTIGGAGVASRHITASANCGEPVTLYSLAQTGWANAAAATGYTFLGWSYTSGASNGNVDFAAGSTTDGLSDVDGSNVNLYGVWQKSSGNDTPTGPGNDDPGDGGNDTPTGPGNDDPGDPPDAAAAYSISYNLSCGDIKKKGATPELAKVSATAGEQVTLYTLEQTGWSSYATEAGYTFLGWSYTGGGSNKTISYQPGESLATGLTNSTGSSPSNGETISLFGVWCKTSELTGTYTILYNLSCGDIKKKGAAPQLDPVTADRGKAVTLLTFEETGWAEPVAKAGYRFLGWSYTGGAANKTVDYAAGSTLSAGLPDSEGNIVAQDGTINLYGVWEKTEEATGTYTINYNLSHGTLKQAGAPTTLNPVTATCGASVTLPTLAETGWAPYAQTAGYTFLGWSFTSGAAAKTVHYSEGVTLPNGIVTLDGQPAADGATINLYGTWVKTSTLKATSSDDAATDASLLDITSSASSEKSDALISGASLLETLPVAKTETTPIEEPEDSPANETGTLDGIDAPVDGVLPDSTDSVDECDEEDGDKETTAPTGNVGDGGNALADQVDENEALVQED